jgi:uncharacterized protein YjbI with pentapeptide repeats
MNKAALASIVGGANSGEVYQVVADNDSQQRRPNVRTAIADAKALATVLAMEAETVLGRRTARFFGALALFAVVVGTLLALLDWYIAPRGAEHRQALVVTLAQILGGAALLSGLYFTWRTLQVNREGQITERYTRAIDQLGKTDDHGHRVFEIRVGGIYALERIARESEGDHGPIMEVMTAYVRQHAPWPPQKAQEGTEGEEVLERGLEGDSGSTNRIERVAVSAPDPDIQAIATVLGRRTRDFLHREDRLDLYNTNLSGVDLFGAPLRSANLWDTNFSGAGLMSADLAWAHLWRANLSRADLSYANLSGADLSGADLSGADLTGANLSRRDPDYERVYGVDYSDVSEGANLSRAKLAQTTLSGADLTGAILTQAQLEEAIGDERTRLPPHLNRPAHWGVKTDEQPEES